MISVERDGGVVTVTIDRPEALNAFDLDTLTALRDRLAELAQDAAARVVVLTGAGDRAFAAGADIKYMSGLDPDRAKSWGELGHEAGLLLETMPKPTVAAINGFALGGGCEMALACDLRYASTKAKLGQPEINLAIIPGWGGTQRLARVAGVGVAKNLILTGRTGGRRRGAPARPRERRLRAGRADGTDARDGTRARLAQRRCPGRGEGSDQPRAAGQAHGEPAGRGRGVRRPLRRRRRRRKA